MIKVNFMVYRNQVFVHEGIGTCLELTMTEGRQFKI
jgi:hypothetical protein